MFALVVIDAHAVGEGPAVETPAETSARVRGLRTGDWGLLTEDQPLPPADRDSGV